MLKVFAYGRNATIVYASVRMHDSLSGGGGDGEMTSGNGMCRRPSR